MRLQVGIRKDPAAFGATAHRLGILVDAPDHIVHDGGIIGGAAMRLAIFSDVHGDLAALQDALIVRALAG